MGSHFLLLIQYFLYTPLAWACSLWFKFFSMLTFLISQPCLIRFWWNWYYLLPYAYITSIAIFRLILLLNMAPEHTSHSKVNDSITHNLTVIFSKEDLYVNVNCAYEKYYFLYELCWIFQNLNLNGLFMFLMYVYAKCTLSTLDFLLFYIWSQWFINNRLWELQKLTMLPQMWPCA